MLATLSGTAMRSFIVTRMLSMTVALSKVIVPSVYNEWGENVPNWVVDDTIKKIYNFSTFLYQKLDPRQPNYIENRGAESGVFLKYIVDHYYDFPDIAVRLSTINSACAPSMQTKNIG